MVLYGLILFLITGMCVGSVETEKSGNYVLTTLLKYESDPLKFL